MTVPANRHRFTFAAFAVSILCLTALWLWAVPAVLSTSTFAFLAVFLIGGATVTLITWRNAQATGSVGQMLHETDVAPVSKRTV